MIEAGSFLALIGFELVEERIVRMSDSHDTEPGHHASESVTTPPRQLTPAQNRVREIRTKAIESLLTDKGLISPESLDAVIHAYETDLGPLNGAKVVARAWVDPAYKERLLQNGTTAIAELGFGGLQGEHLVVVENTSSLHNVIVCALCSCYPWPVLGLPPFWYKSSAYRTRVIGNPRNVLHEFGLDLDASVDIQVWNSSASTRYLVLPLRPNGTETLTEDELAALVTRDAMIGVTQVQRDKTEVKSLSHRRIDDLQGSAALPRRSGELIFQDPWEGEVFAMAVALCEQGLYPWEAFQAYLIAQIAAAEQQDPELQPTYYESWLAALEALVVEKAVLTTKKIESRAQWMARSVSSFRTRFRPFPFWEESDEEE